MKSNVSGNEFPFLLSDCDVLWIYMSMVETMPNGRVSHSCAYLLIWLPQLS